MKAAMLIKSAFHAWERRLASVTTDRIVRPFDWGLDWIASGPARAGHYVRPNGDGTDAAERLGRRIDQAMKDTDALFTPAPTRHYRLSAPVNCERHLTFPSALETPHPEDNTVHCRNIPTP